jgi:hypothetical protein
MSPQTTQAAAPTAPFHFCIAGCGEAWAHSFDGDCCPDDERGQLCDSCVEFKYSPSAVTEDRLTMLSMPRSPQSSSTS